MAVVELAEMKAELGILDSVDDALISAKIDAAQAHLEALLGYRLEDRFPPSDSPASSTVPADLVGAVKMLAAGWYENRESSLVGVSGMEVPHGVWEIVDNRRNYWGFPDGEG
jgi:hypothetical protein